MDVKVLGTGCANCKRTYNLIAQVASSCGISINLVKVENVEDIMQYGVASTPAVVIDGTVVHSGGVPSVDVIMSWFKDQPSALQVEGCCAGGSCSSTAEKTASSCGSGTCSIDVGMKNGMGTGALINLMAGTMILLGFLLAHLAGTVDMLSVSWLWLPAFVGLNLIQFAFTGFCPAKSFFEKLGVKKTCC